MPTVTPGTCASVITFCTAVSSWRATSGVRVRTADPEGEGLGEPAANATVPKAGAAPAGAPASGTTSAPAATATTTPLRRRAGECDMG